ncbi:MAG: hypothetical protein MK089_02095 [Phycisphaerales bacterium]|nr:hypothetical protein [Phycisphaerales bacterium]
MGTLGQLSQSYLARLRGVSSSTWMLAAALIVIMLMGLFLVGLYAGRADMVPLPITLSGESHGKTVEFLKNQNLQYEDGGSVILVNRESRDQIVSQLSEASVITPDQIDFDRLINDERMFLTKGQQRTRTRVATQNVLARMISQMSNINTATVVISGDEDHIGIGRAFVPRTASVTVVPASGPLSPPAVDAIARMVAGSTSGLKATDVSVIDAGTGRAMAARPQDSMSLTRNMETKLATEKMALSRLEDALGYIPGIRISVNAVVESREIVRETTSYEDPKLGVTKEMLSESIRSEGGMGQEPGIRANAGLRVTMPMAQASAGGPRSSDSTERVDSVPAFGRSDQRVIDPGGYALEINASIGVPWSYYATLYRQRSGLGPTDPVGGADFDQLVEASLEAIEVQVLPLIDTGSSEGSQQGEVTVNVFEDVAVSTASSDPISSASWATAATPGIYSTGGLILLIVAALGMMFLMVRRVGQNVVTSTESMVAAEPGLLVDDVDVIGEVDDADVVLDGVEINNDEVRRKVMLDQIREAVQAHPEESASVLRRWTRTET